MADYYTQRELAEALKLSIRTIARMIARQELREGTDFYRVGRSPRFIKTVMDERFHLGE